MVNVKDIENVEDSRHNKWKSNKMIDVENSFVKGAYDGGSIRWIQKKT